MLDLYRSAQPFRVDAGGCPKSAGLLPHACSLLRRQGNVGDNYGLATPCASPLISPLQGPVILFYFFFIHFFLYI